MSYRDDHATLEARRDELRAELDAVTAKAEELRTAVKQEESIARELAAIEARLLKNRKRSPLDDVRVASPCHVSWDGMTGDERARHCAQCDKTVYNLSAMTREEAETLLLTREGSICVRLYRREDGTVITADCPVGRRKKRVKLAVVSTAAAGALAAGALWQLRASTCSAYRSLDNMPLQGVLVEPQDSFVEMPLAAKPPGDVIAVFWYDRAGNVPARRLFVYADQRVERRIDRGALPPLVHETRLSVSEAALLRSLASRLAPRSTGVVSSWADSAAYSGFDLYGTGTLAATEDELRTLRELGDTLFERLPPPVPRK